MSLTMFDDPGPKDADKQREADIIETMNAFHAARDRGDTMEAGRQWVRACELIKGRSRRKVEQMERARGLT